MTARNRLPNRRPAESFEVEVQGVVYTATVGRFPDGTIGELFLSSYRINSSADTAAQRQRRRARALSRDSRGHTTGPLGVALDLVCGEGER
jgi:hypothetical protein